MARKRNLACGSKNPQTPQYVIGLGFEHEDGFGEIHLARDLHHHIAVDLISLRKHRQWIPAKCAVSEHVELEKTIIWHGFGFSIKPVSRNGAKPFAAWPNPVT